LIITVFIRLGLRFQADQLFNDQNRQIENKQLKKIKPDSFKESGFWDTMYSTLLQHYLQKHITQDARKPSGFDENDDMFQLLTCCKYNKLC